MEKIEKIKFGVLGGGYSNEKNISLKSAKAVNEAFFNEGLKSKLIEIHDKTQLFSKSTYKGLDFVFILIHGAGGEDGELQNFFEEICLNLFLKKGVGEVTRSPNALRSAGAPHPVHSL